MDDLTVLTFVPGSQAFRRSQDDYVVEIPSSISDREQLFQVIAEELQFPNYFGYNWDALDELLRDFSWIKQRRIVMVHHDLPLRLKAKDLKSYVEILITAIKDWKQGEEHQLIVVFPLKDRETIQRILQTDEL